MLRAEEEATGEEGKGAAAGNYASQQEAEVGEEANITKTSNYSSSIHFTAILTV